MEGIKMKSWIIIVVGIGIFILFAGMIYGEFVDNGEVVRAIKHVGVFLTSTALFIGAMTDVEEDKFVRLAMLIAGAIIIGLLWGYFSKFSVPTP